MILSFFKKIFISKSTLPTLNEESTIISDQSLNERIIEISFGTIKSEKIKSYNIVSSRDYTNLNFIPIMLFKFFSKLGIFFNFILICLQSLFYYGSDPNDFYPNTFIFILYFFFFLSKNFFIELECSKMDQKINSQICLKIDFQRENVNYVKIRWEDVQVGDFILVKRNERCPADLLICDMKDSSCRVTTKFVDGKAGPTEKNQKLPLYQTSFNKNPNLKSSIENYRKILSGKIVIDMDFQLTKKQKEITGYIKLLKDPRVEYFREENILFRESIPIGTDWIIGLVILCGLDTKIGKKSSVFKLKDNDYFEILINKISVLFIAFAMIFGGFCQICQEYYEARNQTKNNSDYKNDETFLFSFLFASKLVSVLYYFAIDLCSFINKIKLESFYKKEGISDLFVKRPNALAHLNQIGAVIIDKNQTITTNEITISGIFVKNNFYSLNPDDIPLIRDSITQSRGVSHKNSKIPSDDVIPFSTPLIPDEENTASKNISLKSRDKFKFVDDNKNTNENIEQKEKLHINLNFDQGKKRRARPSNPLDAESIKFSMIVENLDEEKLESSEGLKSDKLSILSSGRKRHCGNSTPEYHKTFKDIINDSLDLKKIFETLLLTHSTKTKFDVSKNRFSHESVRSHAKSILDFAEKCGCYFGGSYKITPSKISVYELNLNYGKPLFFPVLAVNDDTKTRKRFSILISEPIEGEEDFKQFKQSTLYIKGDDPLEMIGILNLSTWEKQELIEKIESLRIKGHMPVIYARKKMRREETNHFLKRSKTIKTSLTLNENELEKLYNLVEDQAELVCIICLKENLKEEVQETIKSFHQSQTKILFVSNDNESSTLSTAYHAEIISKEVVFKLNVSTESACLISLKYLLQKLQKNLNENETQFESIKHSEMSKLLISYDFSPRRGTNLIKKKQEIDFNTPSDSIHTCILINGESFRLIYNNKYLRQHLLFLLLFCKIILYSCSELEKKRLTKMIKKIEHNRNKSVLAIGDGYDDVLMMRESDISIEIKYNNNIICLQGDIIVNDFKKIRDIILVYSSEFFLKLEEILYFLFFIHLTMVFTIFYYGWLSQFSSPNILTNINFDIISVLCFSIEVFIYFLFEKNKLNDLKKLIPFIYKIDQRKHKINFLMIFLKCLLPAAFISALTVFFIVFTQNICNGVINLYNNSNLMLILLYLMIFYFKTIFSFSEFKFGICIGSACFILCLYFVIQNSFITKFEALTIKNKLGTQFNENMMVFQRIFIIISCLGIDYFMKLIFQFKYSLSTKLCKLFNKENLKGNYIKNITSRSNFDSSHPQYESNMKKTRRIIKSIFNVNRMDQSVQEIINPTSITSHEINYNPYTLNFTSSYIQKKYYKFERKIVLIFKNLNLICFFITIADIIYNTSIWLKNQLDVSNIVFALFIFLLFVFIITCIFQKSIHSQGKTIIVVCSMILYFLIYFAINSAIVQNMVNLNKIYFQLISITMFFSLLIGQTLYYSFITIMLTIAVVVHSEYNYSIDIPNDLLLNGSLYFYNIYWKIFIWIFFIHYIIYYSIEKYNIEKEKINIFLAEENLLLEKKKINDILSLLVPTFIKNLMYQGNFAVSEDQNNVIVLFADIYEFEKIVAQEQQNLVKLLDSLYRIFDQLCLKNNVQKIETVGKTYMVCAGLKESELNNKLDRSYTRNCADRIINIALEMINYAKKYTWGELGTPISLKIGIHSGPVIAGIIGFHKPQFSLVGDTINTTSRICSVSDPNKVNISVEVYNLIHKYEEFFFVEKNIQAKGKGEIKTYQISRMASGVKRNKEKIKTSSDSENKVTIVEPLKINLEGSNSDNDYDFQALPDVSPKSLKLYLNEKGFPIKRTTNNYAYPKKSSFRKKSKNEIILNSSSNTAKLSISEMPRNRTNYLLKELENKSNVIRTNQIGQISALIKEKDILNKNRGSKLENENSSFRMESEKKIDIDNHNQNQQQNNNNNEPKRSITAFTRNPKKTFSLNPFNILPNKSHETSKIKKGISIKINNPYKKDKQSEKVNSEIKDKKEKDGLNSREISISSESNPLSYANVDNNFYHKVINFGEKNIDQYFEIVEEYPAASFETNAVFQKGMSTIDNTVKKISTFVEDSNEISPTSRNVNQYLLKIHPITLEFKKNQLKDNVIEFNQELRVKFQLKEKINFLMYMNFNLFLSLLWLLIQSLIKYFPTFLVLRLVTIVLGFLFIRSVKFHLLLKFREEIICFFYIIVACQTICFAAYNPHLKLIPEIELLTYYLSISNFSFLSFRKLLILTIIFMVLHIVYTIAIQEEAYDIIFSAICIMLFNTLIFHLKFTFYVKSFNNSRINTIKKKQLNNLISHLLPVHILEKFIDRASPSFNNDYFQNVTILFADIVNFTKYSSTVTPLEVVEMLRLLFTKFDKLSLELNVYKLYTIGDCYVVIGLINSNERDQYLEAKNVVLMGFAMIDIINEIQRVDNSYSNLNMRIGVHTGNIIGGIVGTDIVRYDVYGKDVYIANKMESNGAPGKVLISESTYHLLQNKFSGDFDFEENKEIDIPVSGEKIKSFFVRQKFSEEDIFK